MTVFFRYQADAERERKIHWKAVDDLQKEKDLLASQFEYEKNQVKKHLEDKISDLLQQLDKKVIIYITFSKACPCSLAVVQQKTF